MTNDPPPGQPPGPDPHAGGYGNVPPFPVPQYPEPPYGPQFRVAEAYTYGWRQFLRNAGTILLAELTWVGILVATVAVLGTIGGIGGAILGENIETNAQDEITGGTGSLVVLIVLVVLLGLAFGCACYVMLSGAIRGVLHITYGRELRVRTTLAVAHLGTVALIALIIAAGNVLGMFLCGLGGLIVGFFLQFALFFVMDKDMSAGQAIKASASLVNRKLGSMVGFYLASVIVYFLGVLTFYVGMIVAVPVVLIAQGYAYRVLQGEQAAW